MAEAGTLASSSNSRRYETLDALRGLAALSVVFHHVLLSSPLFCTASDGNLMHYKMIGLRTWLVFAMAYTPLHLFWDGHEAVIFFFVLSGFVLMLPFKRNGPPTYFSFIVRRVFRIYIPYLFVSLFAFLLIILVPHPQILPNFSGWFNGMWRIPLNKGVVLDQLLMLGHYNYDVNTPSWSLVPEMRVSLVFPLIALLVRRVSWPLVLIVALGCACLHPAQPVPFISYYCAFFILGALLAQHVSSLERIFAQRGRWQTLALVVVGLFFYNWRWEVGTIRIPGQYWLLVSDWMVGIGALVLVASAIQAPLLARWLRRPILVWLGSISYSLYLIHALVLLTLTYALHGLVPRIAILACVPPVSIVAAYVLHRVVELPATAWGKSLSGRLSLRQRCVSRPVEPAA